MFKKFLIVFFVGFILVLIGWKTQPAKTTKTVVQFASWGSQSELAILKPILAEFERENPDIKVDFVHIPQNYFQKIHLLFASNLAPDVIFINNLYLPIYAHAGVLQDLGEIASVDENDNTTTPMSRNDVANENPSPLHTFTLSPFYKKALESLSYNDKLYAIPRDVSNMVIYYNKDLFAKYGVPTPNQYWSFNDLLILAQRLTKDTNKDGKTDVWGISFDEDLMFYLPYLMSEGGGVLSDDLKNMIITSPESKKGLQFYTDLRNKYDVAPKKSENASETMAQLFLQGKLAMHLSGRWLVPKYRTDAKFNWNVINFPAGDKGSIVPMDASGWAIAKSSKHKPEAMKLINYLSSKESIEKFTKSGLIVPARIDVAEGTFLHPTNPQKPQNSNVFIDIIKTSKKTPVSLNYKEIQDELKEKTNYLFNSNKSVDEVFKSTTFSH